MNRILRFRFWHIKHLRWVGIETFLGAGYGDLNQFDDDIIASQFIGLRDRNGTDIYEGDILKIGDGWAGIVTYLPSVAAYTLRHPANPNYRFDLYLLDDPEPLSAGAQSSTARTHIINTTRLEVIGNRFEHPNRLT